MKSFFFSLLIALSLIIPQAAKPVGFFTSISYLLCAGGITSYLYKSWHPTAKDIVDRQERIRTYQITVKIKRHVKTIKEQMFSGSQCHQVIERALAYAQQEQTQKLRLVFKPSILLVADWNAYELKNIVTYSLPKTSTKIAEYWDITHGALVDCLMIPSISHNNDALQISLNTYILYGLLGFVCLFFFGLSLLFFVSLSHRLRKKA